MSKLNVAVVGAGLLGTRHARVFHEQADSQTVAVVDVNATRAEDIAARWGARAYTDLKTALADTAIDAVAIATPDHLHRDALLTALEAGKHVFVEKPLATTAEDAQMMAAAAQASDATVMVNYSQRLVTDHAWLKQVIANGDIGAPRMIVSVKFDTIYVPTGMLSWATHTSPFFFMSSHDLDLIHWYLEADPVEVVAREVRGTLEGRGVDAPDGVNVLLQYSNGVSANFHSSWLHPTTYPRVADGHIQIIGSAGAVTYHMRTRTAELFNGRGGQRVEFTGPHTADEVNGKITGAFTESVRHFLSCIQEHREPWTSPRRTLPTTLAQVAVTDSLRLKQAVSVELPR